MNEPLPLPIAQNIMDHFLGFARPMTKEELCDYLKIQNHTLEYYNGLGLPRFKLGNEVRYYLPDVLNFLRSRGIQSTKKRFDYAFEAEG